MATTIAATNLKRYQNAINNARGHNFEGFILAACARYSAQGRAVIDKTPEPFRVTSTEGGGRFTGRFIAHAQPDFQGTLNGGRSICFEAKYTTTDRMRRNVLTETQIDTLEQHSALGACAAVCVGIRDEYFFVPWAGWRDMKKHYGKLHVKAVDLEPYKVKFNGAVMFLDCIGRGTQLPGLNWRFG